ncbi:MAG: FAD-binding oxidoreductase [Rubrivivax sp.]|jgi:D-arginine dehydrogenase|nr:FAD-binding oxidoreductase [Rubrivivax sp.]
MATWDFLVIGGGIAGVSVAAELAPYGRTLVLEQESALGYHATGRSAAIVVPNYGAPPLRALTQASLPTLLEIEVEGHLLAHRKGSLMLELPGQEGVLQASLEDPDRQGRMHEVTLDEALQRVPILRREAIVRAGWEPDVWALDADGLLQWYRRRARAAGAEFRLNAKVTALERVGDVWQVTASGVTEQAVTVVNAAGAWADTLATRAGLRPLGLQPKRRTALTVPAPTGHDVQGWPAVIDLGETRYFKPDAGALMLSLAEETDSPPCDAWADDEDVATAVDRVQQIADLPVDRVISTWAGLRTFAPDRVPVVGWARDGEGFLWLAGHGGYGLQTAPAMAQLAASIVLGTAPPEALGIARVDATALSPGRLTPGPEPLRASA